jgi:magnesium chelatase family protein
MTGQVIEVQVHLSNGLPGMTIVGLPDTSINESRDRVRSAVVNSGFEWPAGRITVGLSPAFEHKRGSGLDFAVAMAVLAGSETVTDRQVAGTVFVGELGLDGSVRGIPGAVAMALGVARAPVMERIFASRASAAQIARVPGVAVIPVDSLTEAVEVLRGVRDVPDPPPVREHIPDGGFPELAEVQGQALACRALEVAAAGGHHILMNGPPGVGKTMLAQRLPGLLPPLSDEQVLEVAAIRDALDGSGDNVSRVPPFCAPHHSASHVAMVGGAVGNATRPGQITLAHHGVLFLDEAPEFSRMTLECLRQPLEEGTVGIARAAVTERLPAQFQLILAANPCPCGEEQACQCTSVEVRRYRSRLSGPLLDRVDLRIRLEASRSAIPAPTSLVVRERVQRARSRAGARLGPLGVQLNARVPPGLLRTELAPTAQGAAAIRRYSEQAAWSRRAVDRILRVAWTVADLAGLDRPDCECIDEAVLLRNRATEVRR